MKRLVPLAAALLAACSQAPSPSPALEAALSTQNFGTRQYDRADGLASHTSGNGAYVVGSTGGSLYGALTGNSDAFLRKVDSAGKTLWARQFGKAGETTDAVAVVSDLGNNAYVLFDESDAEDTEELGEPAGDSLVRKYSPSGVLLWSQVVNDVFQNEYWVTDFAAAGGRVYVLGYASQEPFLKVYGSSGNLLHNHPVSDLVSSVAADSSGNAYVLRGSGAGHDVLETYTPSGGVAWTRQLQVSGGEVAVSGSSVYVAGTYLYNDNPNDQDVRVVKFSASGVKAWERTFGSFSHEEVRSVSASSQGVVFGGYTKGSFAATNQGGQDAYLYRLDPNGKTVWKKQLGSAGTETTLAVLDTPTGVYGAGVTDGSLGGEAFGGDDAFLGRFSSLSGRTFWLD